MRAKLIHLFKPSSVTHQVPFRILWKPESKNNWIIYPHISPSRQKLPGQVPQTWERAFQKFHQNFAFKNPTGYNELLLFPESLEKAGNFGEGNFFSTWTLASIHGFWGDLSQKGLHKKLGSINPPFKRKINATHPSITNPPICSTATVAKRFVRFGADWR